MAIQAHYSSLSIQRSSSFRAISVLTARALAGG